MIKAVSYSRFSSHNQRTESIDAQQRAIYKYIAENQYTPVGDYVDEALTGTNTQRPGFQSMLDDAQKGLFDVVIVHKMDRLSRDVYDALDVQRKLALYGVRIESVIERFEETPEGQLQKVIQLGVGQYYSQNLAREVVKGLKENATRRFIMVEFRLMDLMLILIQRNILSMNMKQKPFVSCLRN